MPRPDKDLRALLAAIGQQDKSAYTALYSELERPLFRFINLKLNDPFQSADILHDVFLHIWRNAAQFEGRSTVKSWVFGIAFRKVMDVFRRQARTDLVGDVPEQRDDAPNAEACLAAVEEAEHVRLCLEGLKPQQRMAVELAFYEDMAYREIAKVMDIPEGTVKTRVFHAKQLLMHCLEGRLRMGVKR